jgi:hypothetical protein
MYDKAIDPIIVGYVVAQSKGACVALVASDINAWAILDVVLVPGSILVEIISTACWHRVHEEWQEVSIAVNLVICYYIGASTIRLSENDGTWGSICPPSVAIHQIVRDLDVIGPVSTYPRTGAVMNIIL